MPPRWLRLPKTPKTPKPKSGLKLRLNVQRWRRLWRAQRSTTSSTTTTIHFYYVWSVASSGISFAKPRKKENRQTTTSPLKPMAQNKATPDAVQTRREGREWAHWATAKMSSLLMFQCSSTDLVARPTLLLLGLPSFWFSCRVQIQNFQ